MCTKFDYFSFCRSKDMVGALSFSLFLSRAEVWNSIIVKCASPGISGELIGVGRCVRECGVSRR